MEKLPFWVKQLPEACRAFGLGVGSPERESCLAPWSDTSNDVDLLLILSGTRTAEVPGISAAGATPDSRRFTAVADAEVLVKGPGGRRIWPLPSLQAGISPALISYAAIRLMGLDPSIIAVGLLQSPAFAHLCLEPLTFGPSNCISTGRAMSPQRAHSLWHRGYLIGRKLKRPLILAESVPGGTTTAQAVLTGLGLSVGDYISGSALCPPTQLKKQLVAKGLNAANLGMSSSSRELISAVGDPFQPVAAGLLIGAREAEQPVLMGGGSQMIAVLALALADLPIEMRSLFVSEVIIGTTAWLVEESRTYSPQKQSSLECLLNMVGDYFGVKLLGLSTGLRFHLSTHKGFRDYENGYVKEGVGAGALALLAQLRGISCKQLVEACDIAMDKLVAYEGFENKSSSGVK